MRSDISASAGCAARQCSCSMPATAKVSGGRRQPAMRAQIEHKYWVGFDLGGSKMLAVVYDEDFRPVARKRKRTRAQGGARQGLERMITLISEALEAAGAAPERLAGIGVGCPGPLDLEKGVALEMPNLGWRKVKVKGELERAFGCMTVVANDVDAGVFGEYRLGAAKGSRCVVGVFPGTGVGGGAVYEGHIIRGARSSALEIGHVPVVRDGPLCGCGRRGCLEAVAGRLAISAAAAMAAYRGEAPFLLQNAGTDLHQIRSRALADAIAAGDKAIEAIVREAARTIGWAMAGVVNVLAPDKVLLGGGLVNDMPDLFRSEIEAALRAQVMPSYIETFKVVAAELGDDAAVIGAAALVQQAVEGALKPAA
jgi:glucokinase